jgi:PAS domain S-box-containing protein
MPDDNLSREELLAESVNQRRRVEELEAENFSLRELEPRRGEAPPRKNSDRIDDPFVQGAPEFREIEDDYRAVVESSSEAICITQDGDLKFANPASTRLTGYSIEELLSRPFAALTHPEDLEELTRIYLMRLRGEVVPPGHRFRIIAKDGEMKWVESWSASIEWKGRPAVVSMIRDVTLQVEDETLLHQTRNDLDCQVQETTAELQEVHDQLMREISERNRAELSARRGEYLFGQLLENSPMGIAVTDMKGQVEYLNKKFVHTFGYTLQDIPTLEHWLQLAYPDPGHADRVRSEWLSATREAAEEGTEAESTEREVRCKDGTIRIIEFRKAVVDKWVIHTLHDITGHKRQEEALRESEQMFRLLSEQSLMSVAILQDGIYKYANRAMSALCEYSSEEILNWGPEEFLAVVHPDDRSLVMEQARMKQVGDFRQQTNYSFRIVTKSGKNKWVDIYSKTIQFKGSSANLLTMLDITERKKAEEARSETENRYRSLVETSPDPIILYDLAGNLITVNQQAAIAYGVEFPEQLLAEIKNVSDILDEEGQKKAAENLERTLASGSARKSEYSVIRKDGGTFPVEINSSMIRNTDGAPVAFISVVRDITDRKRAEDQIKNSRAIMSSIFDSVPQSIFWKDKNSVYLGCNEVFARAVGLESTDEIVGKTDYDLPWPRDEAEAYRADDQEVMGLNQAKRHIIEPLQQADGTRLWIDTTKVPLTEEDGTVYGVLGVYDDITERKRSEEALQESEERFRTIFQTSPDAVSISRISDGVYVDVNAGFSELTGFTRDELIEKSSLEINIWNDPGDRNRIVAGLKERGHVTNLEAKFRLQDGRVRIGLLSARIISLNGEPHMLSVTRDVHDWKKAEEALQESMEKYRSIVENSLAGIFTVDEAYKFIYANDELCRILGYSRENLLGLDFREVLTNDCRALVVDRYIRRQSGENVSSRYEIDVVRGDGKIRNVEMTIAVVTDASGLPRSMGQLVDITERKRTEGALRAKTEELDRFFTAALDLLCIADTDGYFRRLNPEWQTVLGYPLAELEGKRFLDFVHPEDLEATVAVVSRLASQEAVLNFTNRHRCQDGSYRWIEWRSYPAGKLIYAAGRDVTERKLAEEALAESEQRFRMLLEASFEGLAIIEKGRFLDLSDQLAGMLGYEREELLGEPVMKAVAPESRDVVAEAIRSHRRDAYEHQALRKDGTAFVCETRGRPIFIGDRRIRLTALRDITERKQAERALRESEERLRMAWNTSPDCFSISRLHDGLVVDVNKGFNKLTGYTREEVVGRSSIEFGLWVDPDDRAKLISGLTLDGEVRGFETRFRRKEGEIRTVEISAGIMTLEGEPHFLAIMKDVEESKRAQVALARSEELFRKYFELGLVGMALTSPDKGWVHVNDQLCEILGYTRDELVQTTWNAVTHPDDLELELVQFNRMLAGEVEGYFLDKRFISKDGALVYTTLHVSCIRKADGTVDHVIANLHDITDRKRAEEALRKSEQLLRQVLDTIPVRLFWKDTESVFLGCNRLFASDSGLQSPEELVGKTDFDMVWQEQARLYRDDDRQVMESGTPKVNYEEPQTTPEGRRIWLRTSKVPLLDPDARIKGVLGTYEDITESKRADEENLRLRRYVENIINSMPSLLVGIDRECRVTQWNAAAETMTGVSAKEARGRMLSDIMPMLSKQLDRVQRAIRDRVVQSDLKVPRTTESGTRFEDITVFPLASNGVEGAVIRVDDVTERVRIEEMMIQTEKMLSVGGLAAGMAHEVNNPLGVMMQATQNVLRRLSPELPVNVRVAEECGLPLEALRNYLARREIFTFLEDIRSSGQRAADVVSNMLSFSRKSEKAGSSESLSELLDRTLVLAGSDYDLKKKHDFRQIEIVREYDPNTPNVVCKAGRIQQVFLNILRNGAEAMQENRAIGRVPQFILRVRSEGHLVRVEIEDNGPGMEESIRRRVFEPFFTTKPPGVGTGLGMSVSYFIISDDHGGTMEIESTPGNGARLIIRLPVQGRTS